MNRTTTIAVLACASLAAACTWSVPADPGENARLRSASFAEGLRPSAARAGSPSNVYATRGDDGARGVYLQKCSKCHEPFAPTHATAAEWPALVRRYGPRAGLFGQDRERVLAWLQANAR